MSNTQMFDHTKLDKFYAGGFLYNPQTNEVFLHKRDGNTKFNPNAWAFFGGLNEPGETPVECFVRELEEETGLKVSPSDVIYLYDYLNKEFNTHRYVFYVITNVAIEELTLGEGAGFGWISLDEIDKYKLTEKTERDLRYFMKQLGLTVSYKSNNKTHRR